MVANSPAKTVAFIGLGVMGYPMAGHLHNSGLSVQVYNRTREKALAWQAQYGGQVANSPREAAQGADVVFTCVGDDDDLRSVILGEDGALAGMKADSILVDHTTASAQLARELHSLARQQHCGFLDAPVSGGQKGAELGALSIMVGGEAQVYAQAEPVFRPYAKAASLIGSPGAGQLCKMVNQICIAGLLEGLSEGLHFAQNAGLDVSRVIEVISKGAAQSWQMENRSATMMQGEYNHGFAVDWMRKDLRIALNEARANGSQLPVTALVDQFYAEVQAMGGKRWDTSSLLARLQRTAGDSKSSAD
jgi:3-hydroxyisobutyrate dehydrogenase-like beta-hydroxyacid dehydrogenase